MNLMPMEKYAVVVGSFFLIAVLFAPFFLKLRRKARKAIRSITKYEHENGMDDLILGEQASKVNVSTDEEVRVWLTQFFTQIGEVVVARVKGETANRIYKEMGKLFIEYADDKTLPHLLTASILSADRPIYNHIAHKPNISDSTSALSFFIHRYTTIDCNVVDFSDKSFTIGYEFFAIRFSMESNILNVQLVPADLNEARRSLFGARNFINEVTSNGDDYYAEAVKEFVEHFVDDLELKAGNGNSGESGSSLTNIFFGNYLNDKAYQNYFNQYPDDHHVGLRTGNDYLDLLEHSKFGTIVFDRKFTLAELQSNDRGGLFHFVESSDVIKEGVRTIDVYPNRCSLFKGGAWEQNLNWLDDNVLIASTSIVTDMAVPSGLNSLPYMEYLFYYVQLADILKIAAKHQDDAKGIIADTNND